MQGDEKQPMSLEKAGIIQRASVQIFEMIKHSRETSTEDETPDEEEEKKADNDHDDMDEADLSETDTMICEIDPESYQIFVSIYQIYNETINDLLQKDKLTKNLKTRQDSKGNFYVDGLKYFEV